MLRTIIGVENSAIQLHRTSTREEEIMYIPHYPHSQTLAGNLWDLVLGRDLWKKRPTGGPEPGPEACPNPIMRREGGGSRKNIRKLIMLQVRTTQGRMDQLNSNNNSNHHHNLRKARNHKQGPLHHRQIRTGDLDRTHRMRKTPTRTVHHPPEVEVGAGMETPLAEAELMKRPMMIPLQSLTPVDTTEGALPRNAAKHAGIANNAKEGG